MFGRVNPGEGPTVPSDDDQIHKEIVAAGWEVIVPGHGDGDIEVKICAGDISQIKQQLLAQSPANVNELPGGAGGIDTLLFNQN
jgi:hypothetical protein